MCVNVVFARLPVKLVNSFSLVVETKLSLVYIKCVMLNCSMFIFLSSRLKEADMKVSLDKPAQLARRTEKELFALFQGVDSKYKNKYRSLTFNLKDAKNKASI